MILRTSFLLAWNVYIKFSLNVALYSLYTSTLHFSRKQELEELNGSARFQIQCNDYTILSPPLGFDQKAESGRR
jgi:hypothetical protein